jgi:hypothetical protein
MPDTEFNKIYVRPDNSAVLTCPHCGLQKVILADSFRGYKHKLKVKCSCNYIFNVFLEFRKRVRKRTHLRGTFVNKTQKSGVCTLVIRDISVIGLTFTTLETSDIKVGDELSIRFNLNDEYQTEVRRDAVVRNVRPGFAGGEFEVSNESVFQGPLGHYVTS